MNHKSKRIENQKQKDDFFHLSPKWKRTYRYLRLGMYLGFFIAGLFVINKILFPTQEFAFDFNSPNANKNSIIKPRNAQNVPYGSTELQKEVVFDTSLVGNYSQAEVTLQLEKSDSNLSNPKLSTRKSFQAFFYPLKDPVGFKEGSLISNEGNYYILSSGALRKFSSQNLASEMGYDKNSFTPVSNESLNYDPQGKVISEANKYPDGTIFSIEDEYFQLVSGTIKPFVSEKAYLTQYPKTYAISKSVDFLSLYPLSEEYIGFADGTSISAGISAYIVSGKESYPVNNPVTFESMGYKWEEVISANSEEVGIYDEQKLFSLSSPHPDGTIFKDISSKNYYLVKNETKRLIPTEDILNSYMIKNSPIEIDSQSLEMTEQCQLKKSFIFKKRYKCTVPIDSIDEIIGNNYQFNVDFSNSISASALKVKFEQTITEENLLKSLATIKNRITNNYSPAQ